MGLYSFFQSYFFIKIYPPFCVVSGVDFGAFVDIGVHEDGLVHLSQLCNRYVKHPSEVVSVGDIVNVRVLSVDLKKKRIALTMKTK